MKYPMNFKAQSQASNGTGGTWEIKSYESQAKCAIPPEFGGPGGAFSPEDLFAQALTNCFVATFKVYAQASRVEFQSVDASSDLVVDLNEAGKPVMKKLVLNVQIQGTKQSDRAKTLAEKAFASGFILNSVKTELEFNLQVS